MFFHVFFVLVIVFAARSLFAISQKITTEYLFLGFLDFFDL